MKGRTKRTYTAEQRATVVADVSMMGVCGAARKHEVSNACVSRWASEAGVRRGDRAAVDVEEAPPATVPANPRRGDDDASSAKSKSSAEGTGSKGGSRAARLYTPSQKAQALEYVAEHGVTAAAKHLGISRFSLYSWREQAEKAAVGEGEAPTSGQPPEELEKQRDQEILTLWRKHPGLGPSQIVNQLRRAGIKVGVHTVRRVMQDAGYRPPKVRREGHTERYEAVRPNHLWHLDYVQRYINRASTFTLILIDDYSRFVVGHGVDDAERAGMVIETFAEAVQRHGRPERVMHDKGSAFWAWRGISRFTNLLVELGVDQVVAEHKEWNGKIEVFNGNLHKELFNVQRFHDVAQMRRQLERHLHWYNHARTHHALGGLLVPADRYYGRVEEVMARIEAGTGRDADSLELRERCLDLFRVTSRAGVPEVWLLGNKLFGAQSATP